MKPLDKRISDLCVRIKNETDGTNLRRLIDQLDVLTQVRPKLNGILGRIIRLRALGKARNQSGAQSGLG